MKRILAILLFAAMLFSLPLVTATAAENTKIEEALQTKMEETPDDEKIEVWIWTT